MKTLLLGLVSLLLACASPKPRSAGVAGTVPNDVKCVAVVTFENRTEEKGAGEVAAALVTQAALAGRKFRVMDAGSVSAFLRQQRIRIAPVTDVEFAADLGRLLGVDGILMGSVDEYAYRNAGGKAISEPSVSYSARLVRTEDQSLVWSREVRKVSDSAFSSGGDILTRVGYRAAEDLMATIPSNVTSEEVLQGCGHLVADLDVDGDTILNMADRCPYQAESFNGVDDEDGCPEDGLEAGLLRRLVDMDGDRLRYDGEIRFLPGTDTLVPQSVLLVRAIAVFVNKESTRIPKIQVEGNSSDEGTKRYRELFAFSRAEAVKQVLLKNGVDPGRLTSVGYDAQSAAKPRSGKAIEFLILE